MPTTLWPAGVVIQSSIFASVIPASTLLTSIGCNGISSGSGATIDSGPDFFLVRTKSGEVLRYEPDEADLRSMERKLLALWAAIERAHDTGDWRPNPSRLCDWCAHSGLRNPDGSPKPAWQTFVEIASG